MLPETRNAKQNVKWVWYEKWKFSGFIQVTFLGILGFSNIYVKIINT
jgi:hypothetical protein